MKRLLAVAAAAAVTLTGIAAAAQPAGHCPPGLARKNPPCVPPGQARKWSLGDRYDGVWTPVDWRRYNLPAPQPGEQWVRVGDSVIKVSDETGEILAIVALAAAILGG